MDEWIKRYQDAYSHLNAPDHVRDAIAHMRPSTRSSRSGRKLSFVLATALMLLALLGCGVAVMVYGTDIQSVFARRWQSLTGHPMNETQNAYLDHLSQEIGLSQTVDGVTVTLDSAAVGDDIVYLLVRVEDTRLTKGRGCSFESFSLTLSPDPLDGLEGIGGCGWSTQGTDSEGRPLLLVQHGYTLNDGSEINPASLELTLTLTDLYQNSGNQQSVLAKGTWEFHVSLDRTQISAPIQLPDTTAVITDIFSEERCSGAFTNIQVTSTGIRYDQTFAGGEFPDFIPVLVLNSGVEISGGDGSGTRIGSSNTLRCSHHWSIPVDLDEAVSVRLGDTEIPLS